MEDGVSKDSSKAESIPIDHEENTESQTVEDDKESCPPEQDDDEIMRTTKAQVGEAREENQRLKQLLSDIVKEYQSLQNNFFKIIQQDKGHQKELKHPIPTQKVNEEETDFISLSLGRSNTNDSVKKDEAKSSNDEKEEASISLALDCKLDDDSSMAPKSPASPNSSEGNNKGEDQADTWPPSKTSKSNPRPADEVILQQPPTKKTRVSVRARCDTPTMHDGCQWRKYGQKIAKGNPCPRAYYRCTISPNCPVRKQIQRCVEDMSILVTTYEGTHNHPLPLSATSMASTTSAAVSMLNSNSSTSQQVGSLSSSISAPISSNGLQFSLPQNGLRPHQFPFRSTSISTYNSHPTITLDLTNHKAPSPHIFGNRVPSTSASPFSQPYLNFAPPAQQPNPWNSSYPSYGTVVQNQPSFEELQGQNLEASQQAISTEAITAATKILIASNPTLRNALAAAISSLTGNGNVGTRESGVGQSAVGPQVGFGQSLPLTSPSNQNGTVTCGSSYWKPSQTMGSQQSSLSLFPLLPHSSSKSNSPGSPTDSKDHTM